MLQVSAPFPSSVGGVNHSPPPTANAIPGQAGAIAPSAAIPSNQQTNAGVPAAGTTSQPDTDAQGNNTETPTRGEYAQHHVEQEQKQQQRVKDAELKQSQQLGRVDREVRAHEAAHAAVGGRFTRGTSFTFRLGPDGRLYAIGGEVKIDTTPVPGNPEATLQKAETIRAAALAPIEPSNQDRSVALAASRMAALARLEIQQQRQNSDTNDSATDSPSGSDSGAEVARPLNSRIAAYFRTQPSPNIPGSHFQIAV